MDNHKLLDILKLRSAIYAEGYRCGHWSSLEDNNAKEFMKFLFPKSGGIAYYNLILEVVRNKHIDITPAGNYSLFKLPGQIEEQLLYYLKEHPETNFLALPGDPAL